MISAGYDIADLRNLLRRNEALDLAALIRRTIEGFQFPGALTELER